MIIVSCLSCLLSTMVKEVLQFLMMMVKHFDYQKGKCLILNIDLKCTNSTVELTITKSGGYLPKYNEIKFRIPISEERDFVINGNMVNNGFKLNLNNI